MTARKARTIFLVLAVIALANLIVQIVTGPDVIGLLGQVFPWFAAGAWAHKWFSLREDGAD